MINGRVTVRQEFFKSRVGDLDRGLGVVDVGRIEAAGVMDNPLAGVELFARQAQGMDQFFLLRALGPADIPELLAPVISRRRVVVLLAASHGSDDRVTEQALVIVLAIKAKPATAAQGAHHLVDVQAAVLQDDVELRLALGVYD